MNENEKQEYHDKYEQAKKKGLPFFPDILFKDAVISLLIFLILVALAYFVGAPLEPQADPADTNYTPRPEWYFIFLFQLLKYFPGQLEVIGVFIIPTLAIILLFVLPLLDRSPRRHFLSRPVVITVVALASVGVVILTILSILEAPPPTEAALGDPIAGLYTKNCAPCHGPSITVPAGTNLHDVIAKGKHEDMPAWNADLTTDEIDALAGFILSPGGSQLFTEQCEICHDVSELVATDPFELKNALEEGIEYIPHSEVEIPQWTDVLSSAERTTLLNFLIAPDGQRLFVTNCAACHGRSVAFSGEEDQLRTIISQGGLHLEMPPWREILNESEFEVLVSYILNPTSVPEGKQLFEGYCSECHGDRVPVVEDAAQAHQALTDGGAHQTMPVWGDVLTEEQLDALVQYTMEASSGAPIEVGRELFVQNCAPCHGDFGEGGANPTRPGDIIAPISSAEYLKTRDDFTLRAVIAQGQPNFGMAPFGNAFGGSLDDEEIDAIVAYMRTWEQNPPVELPPEFDVGEQGLTSEEIYVEVCAQCHGITGEGLVGPPLADPEFQSQNSDQDIFDTINLGHEATAMIAWGDVFSADQIRQLVEYIRQFEMLAVEPTSESEDQPTVTPTPQADADVPSFAEDIMPIFEDNCAVCHGSLGGWDASSYDFVINSGNNGPSVIPGDAENSLLAQKILGTHAMGTVMPPNGKLLSEEISLILDWIDAGAPDN
jgi:mono/diheme cytochrome c family protein